MRRCPQTFLEHSSVGSFPVLLFLAPRLLAPWPAVSRSSEFRSAKIHSSQSVHTNEGYIVGSPAEDHVGQLSLLSLPPTHRKRERLSRPKSHCAGFSESRKFHSSVRQHQSLEAVRSDESFRMFGQQCHKLNGRGTRSTGSPRTSEASLKQGGQLLNEESDTSHSISAERRCLLSRDTPNNVSIPGWPVAAERPTKTERTTFAFRKTSSQSTLSSATLSEDGSQSLEELFISFAYTQMKRGDYESALQALTNAVQAGTDVASKPFKHVCNALIRRSRNLAGSYQSTSHIVQALIDLGVRLDITSYNILMNNAAEAGDHGTTWKIYQLIRRNKIEPDHYTWTTLLKTCRKTNDRSSFRKTYKQILEQEAGRFHSPLVTEILATWSHFGARSGFERLVRFYERHCDLQILKDLGLVHSGYKSQARVIASDQPSTETLVVMLLAYVRKEQSILHAADLYRTFQRLLAEHHPLVVPLGESVVVYGIFMKAFGMKDASLKLWPRLLRDMIKPLGPEVLNRDTGLPFQGCKPNAIFWNILLNAFARRHQLAAAEKVIELMRKQGFKPDKYSYTSLMGGYARQQNIEMTIDVLQRMQEDNISGDEHTVKALQLINDRPQLLGVMQKLASGHAFGADVDADDDDTDNLDDAVNNIGTPPSQDKHSSVSS